jgi:hypothetical protein
MRSIRECANGVSFLATFADFFANFAVKSFFTAKNAKIAAKNAKKI